MELPLVEPGTNIQVQAANSYYSSTAKSFHYNISIVCAGFYSRCGGPLVRTGNSVDWSVWLFSSTTRECPLK